MSANQLLTIATGTVMLLWAGIMMLVGRRRGATKGRPAADGLHLADQRLRRLLDQSPDTILVMDETGRLLDGNRSACRILGYKRPELLRLSWDDIEISRPEPGRSVLSGPEAAEFGKVMPGLYRRRNGSTFPVEISLSGFYEKGRRRLIAASRDVSERDQQRQELERAVAELSQANARAEEANFAKNHFLQNVSYKLRTPLNSVLGMVEMLEAGVCGPIDNPKVGEYLGDIHGAANELMVVINELASVATVEAAIAADKRSWRTVIEMSPDAICLCQGGGITFINSAGVRLLGGYAAVDFEGRPFKDLVHPDFHRLVDMDFARLGGETRSVAMRFLHPAGLPIDVMVSVAAAPEGDGTTLVVARNISDIMRANRDVAIQATRLNNILDTAVDAIVVCDETGIIETFNHSAETMFGYGASEAIGRNVAILMNEVDADAHQHYIRRYLAAGSAKVIGLGREVTAQRKNGTSFPVEVSLSVCQLEDRRLFTAMIRDVTERRNFEDYLAHSATHDTLTGLPNRRLLQERLQQALEQALDDGTMVSVWFVDLDGFKTINDVMGHAAGDELLVAAGRRMVAALRPGDIVARFGGDEFAMILSGLHGREDVIGMLEPFLREVGRPFALRGREVTLSANVGISLYPEQASVASELVVHAGAAMLVAKASGHNLYRFFDPSMHQDSAERLTLESELRRGIERGELLLHYQPQIALASGCIIGLEALVRWQHPTLGMVPPGRFIALAEETGLIVPLGEWVLRQACRDLRRLEEMGLEMSVAVNISPRQFSDTDVLAAIHQAIGESGINPCHLDVEITEGSLMNNPEEVIVYLERMKTQGIRLSIDDFGTGYSSLSYLKRFPMDTLKIDRSFVIDIANNPKDEAIAVTIITLAHAMGMTVLAEGVEEAAQAYLLEKLGCDVIQGYFYSRPLSFAAITEHLLSGSQPTAVMMAG